MSPVAISSTADSRNLGRSVKSASTSGPSTPSTGTDVMDNRSYDISAQPASGEYQIPDLMDTPPRRASPWHDLAHSLSIPSPARRPSSSFPSSIPSPPSSNSAYSPQLSTSQALREWEARIANPTSTFSRHTLIPPSSSPISLEDASPGLVPKLVPERDREGHIEYKLKLIDPSPERFEKLVSQLLWRLKQGRSEALYEIGLADDGTVIGLSRAEMDASLRTLELMAGEVGATVLILKEIVLTTPTPSTAMIDWNMLQSQREDSPAGWVVPPQIDPAIGAALKLKEKKKGGGTGLKRCERRAKWTASKAGWDGQRDRERPIIFDTADVGSSSDSEESSDARSRSNSLRSDRSDDDVPPFLLDMDDVPSSNGRDITSAQGKPWAKKRTKGRPTQAVTDEEKAEREQKKLLKAQKSNARREARRLDLLRGDGMSPSGEPSESISCDAAQSASPTATIPQAVSRPSSLRLSVPPHPADPTPEWPIAEGQADTLVQDLLAIPLDSLSLSFADVRTIKPSSFSSSSSSTEYAPTWVSAEDSSSGYVITGDEKICVEALVVRKMAVDEEEGWGWGGHDDGWGLSAERDDVTREAFGVRQREVVAMRDAEFAGDIDEDDSWGFG